MPAVLDLHPTLPRLRPTGSLPAVAITSRLQPPLVGHSHPLMASRQPVLAAAATAGLGWLQPTQRGWMMQRLLTRCGGRRSHGDAAMLGYMESWAKALPLFGRANHGDALSATSLLEGVIVEPHVAAPTSPDSRHKPHLSSPKASGDGVHGGTLGCHSLLEGVNENHLWLVTCPPCGLHGSCRAVGSYWSSLLCLCAPLFFSHWSVLQRLTLLPSSSFHSGCYAAIILWQILWRHCCRLLSGRCFATESVLAPHLYE